MRSSTLLRSIGLALVACLTLGTAATTAAPAQATSSTVLKAAATSKGAKNETTIRKRLAAAGVSKKTQDALIKKLRKGKKWDALTKGKKPKKTKKYDSGSSHFVKKTYADGSIMLIEVKNKPNPPSANGFFKSNGNFSDCTAFTADHYHVSGQGCDVSATLIGLYSIYYTFDYTAAPGYRAITSQRNLRVNGGFISNPRFEVQSQWDIRGYADLNVVVLGNTFTATTFLGIRIETTGAFTGYTPAG